MGPCLFDQCGQCGLPQKSTKHTQTQCKSNVNEGFHGFMEGQVNLNIYEIFFSIQLLPNIYPKGIKNCLQMLHILWTSDQQLICCGNAHQTCHSYAYLIFTARGKKLATGQGPTPERLIYLLFNLGKLTQGLSAIAGSCNTNLICEVQNE